MIFKLGVILLAILLSAISFIGISTYNKCKLENKKDIIGKNNTFLIVLTVLCFVIIGITFFVDIV